MCVRIELITLDSCEERALTPPQAGGAFTPDNFCLDASLPLVIGHLFWGFESKKWQSLYKRLWFGSASWVDNDR